MSLLHGQWRRKVEVLPLLTGSEEHGPQQLDLKPLPHEVSLLQILHRNKKAIGWKISDFISPTVCTHHIYLEEESKAVRQPQRRLNPHMEEVVRVEVLKLLQADIIYPYLIALG